MSPVSRGRKSKKQKRVQKSRQRSARAAVQRQDTQFADLLAGGKRGAADRVGDTVHLLHAAVGFRMGADCFPDDVGLARCDLRTEAE
jgi:hypothetical protein